MHSFLALIILVQLFPNPEVLVKVDNLPTSEAKVLLENGIEVWEHNNRFSLIVCTQDKIPANYKTQILDNNPRKNSYFIIQPLEPIDYTQYTEFIQLLWVDKELAIVKATGVRPKGIKFRAEIKKVRNKPIIINLNRPELPSGTRQNPLIEEMIANIDSAMMFNYTKRLQDFRTRNNYNDSIISAAAYVFNEFTQSGLDLVYYSESGTDPWGNQFLADNIVGIKYGETDSALIVCAHLDATAGDPYNPENFAPGADDNASGCAGVLAAAKVMAPYDFHRELRFICFVGEELGLYGSAQYADSCAGAGSHIVGVYNMDMICHRDQGNVEDLDADDNLHTPSGFLSDTLIHFGGIYVPALPIIERHLTGGSSDHASFQNAGYPAILTIDDASIGANPYIHSPGDTIGPSANDFILATNSAKAVVATVAELAGILGGGIGEENRIPLSFIITPTIVKGSFDITIKPFGSSSVTVSLFDITGREVLSLFNGRVTKTLRLKCPLSGSLAGGVYFIAIRSSDEKIGAVKKVVFVK